MDILKPHFKLFLRPGLTSLTKVPQKWLRIYATCSPSPKLSCAIRTRPSSVPSLFYSETLETFGELKHLTTKISLQVFAASWRKQMAIIRLVYLCITL